MQYEEAQRLRQAWKDKPCAHPDYAKEYYLGVQTTDYVCTTCGAVLSDDDVAALKEKRGSSRPK